MRRIEEIKKYMSPKPTLQKLPQGAIAIEEEISTPKRSQRINRQLMIRGLSTKSDMN